MKSLGQKKFKDKSPEEVNKILSDAWLNIVVDDNKIFNPITNIPEYLSDKPHIYYTWLMSQPEYFSFLCSEILNVNILPFQSVILQELWNRKFPMLIATRGAGKSLKPDELVLYEHGWKPIIDLNPGDKVYSGDGKLYNIKASTGLMTDLNFYKLLFEDGREIECCEDHTWLVTDNSNPLSPVFNNIDTKSIVESKKIQKDRDFFIPVAQPIEHGNIKPSQFETHPYLMGLILGSGYFIEGKVHLTIFSKNVLEKLKNLNIKLECDNQHEQKYIFDAPIFPINIYEHGTLESRQEFLSGLISQNFPINGQTYQIFHNTKYTDTIVNIIRSCGYFCYYKKYNYNSRVIIDFNKKTCKIKDIIKANKQSGCCIEVDSPDHTYITKDYIVTHNSFILGLYSMIRAFLMPKRKIVICGAAFRQSKVVYEYASNIWHNSPLLRDIIGTSGNNGPRNMTDMCRLTLKDSMISALPIGCLTKDTWITTDTGLHEIGFFSEDEVPYKIFSQDNYEEVGFFFDNGLHDTIKVVTDYGYEYTATPNHKMKVLRNGEVVWVRTDEMTVGDNILINTQIKWPEKTYDISDLAEQHGKDMIFGQILGANKENARTFILSLISNNSEKIDDKHHVYCYTSNISKILHYMLLHFGVKANRENSVIVLSEQDLEQIKHEKSVPIATDRIKEIKFMGIEHTVDLNIPTNNTYTANGFISHNTGDKIRGQRASDILSDEFSCLTSDTLVQTDIGLIPIKEYLNGDAYDLLNKDREFETPERVFKTPLTDVYKVSVQNGYEFKCSEKHQVMTTDGWKLAKDLTSDDNLVLETNNFFPEKYLTFDGVKLDEKIGWLLGILVSEGTVTNRNYIGVVNTDRQLIDFILKEYSEYDWKEYYRPAYISKRGWKCKESWDIHVNDTKFRHTLFKMGLKYVTSHRKNIPHAILKSPRSVVTAFLSGLMEGDSSMYNYNDKGKTRIGAAYYSVNKKFIQYLQVLMLKFGITASITPRRSKISDKKNYMLVFRGEMAYKLYNLIDVIKWRGKFNNADFMVKKPSINKVTKKTTKYYLSTYEGNKNKYLGSFNSKEEAEKYFYEYQDSRNFVFRVKDVKKLKKQQHLYDFYMPKTNSFIGNGFIQHNSIPRDIFETVIAGFAAVSADPANNVRESAKKKMQELMGLEIDEEEDNFYSKTNQIAISGTAYYDFNHFATYWKKWHDIITSKGDKKKLKQIFKGEIPDYFNWKDYSIMRIPYNLLPYGFMDQGQLARSKATVHSGIFLMEFSACQTFDTPIITDKGIKKIIDINIGDLVLTHKGRFKPVIKKTYRDWDGYLINFSCGEYSLNFTPDHPFWVDGDDFIEARYIKGKTNLASTNGIKSFDVTTNTFPYKGFVYNLEVEEDHSYSTPIATVHNCFCKDSNGFFKRSLIESCTVTTDKSIMIDGKEVIFDAMIKGDPKAKYVYAVDPASEADNLSILILEIHPNHRRVVYCWTTNRKEHIERVKSKLISETDFYSYCAKKIRELMKTFTPERIAIDSQGGGVAIIEALHDKDKIAANEVPLWEIIETGVSKPSDVEQGLHIIEKINFASVDFTSGSNHGLRKDMEDKIILFPFFNAAALSASLEEDNIHGRIYDTLEDCMMEIEELKNELTTIVVTNTDTGRERWDTPDAKIPGMKKGKLRKDRYSALLMANYSARNLDKAPKPINYETTGGFADSIAKNEEKGVSFIGTPWLTSAINNLYD